MKKLKKFLAILLCFAMLFGMNTIAFAVEESDTPETKYALLAAVKKGTTDGFLTYDYYKGNDTKTAGIYAGYSNSNSYNANYHVITGNITAAVLMKIDMNSTNLSTYKTKDIQKVELLFKSNATYIKENTSSSRTVKVVEATSDWDTGERAALPTYDDNSSVTRTIANSIKQDGDTGTGITNSTSGYEYRSIVNDDGYNSDATVYDSAIEITNFVTTNLNNGENETKLMLYGSSANYQFNGLALFITYKDNNKPAVVVNKVEGESSVTFSGTISDADSDEITSATYSVDGGQATAISLTDGAYNFALDTTEMTSGKHTIIFTATDSLGAVTTRNVEFIANKPAVNYSPEILVKLPAPFSTATSVTVPFEVYDANGDEFTISAKIDDDYLTVAQINNSNYSVTISAENMTEGNHTLSITATDFWNDTDSTSTYERRINVSGTAWNRAVIAKSDSATYVYSSRAFTSSKPTSGNYIIYKNNYDFLAKYDLSAYADKQIDKVEIIFARTKEYLVRQMEVYTINDEWTSADLNEKGIENFPSYDENVAAVGVFSTTNGVSDAGYTEITGGYDCVMDITDYAFEKLNNDETMLNLLFRCSGGIWMGSTVPKIVVTYKDDEATTHGNVKITKYKNGITKGSSDRFAANTSDVEWSVAGNTSSETSIDENGNLTIGADEAVGYITVIATAGDVSDSVYVRVLGINENEFGTPVMKFGVLSDIHMRTTSKNAEKFKTAMKGLQTLAGGKDKLGALLLSGDIADAIGSVNNRKGFSDVAAEAYSEVSSFKNSVKEVLDDNTMVLYSLGNHDTNGAGKLDTSVAPQSNLPTINIAEYFVKVLSGWNGTDDYDSFTVDTNSDDYKRFFGSDDAIGTVEPASAEEIGLYNGNRHVKFNGYHFIAVEPAEYAAYYSNDTCDWVRSELKKATEADPNKPIFVITHPVIYDTTSESKATDSNISANLTPVLKEFPQVILWTGHVHSPLNVDNAIMQNGFTALSSSSTYYLSSIIGLDEDVDPSTKDFPMGSYVEIDADGNVKISRYLLADENNPVLIDEPLYIMGTSKDGSHLYSYDKSRKLYNNVPTFAENAKVSIEASGDGNLTVSFPKASDDGTVVYYDVNITDCNGDSVNAKISSRYYTLNQIPDEYSRTIDCSSLDTEGEMIVMVSAVDEWSTESLSISNLDVSVVNVSCANNGNGAYTVSGTLVNSSKNAITGEAIYALYNAENSLLQIGMLPVDAAKNTQKLISNELIYNGNDIVSYAKIFVWDSLSGLKPLMKSASSK